MNVGGFGCDIAENNVIVSPCDACVENCGQHILLHTTCMAPSFNRASNATKARNITTAHKNAKNYIFCTIHTDIRHKWVVIPKVARHLGGSASSGYYDVSESSASHTYIHTYNMYVHTYYSTYIVQKFACMYVWWRTKTRTALSFPWCHIPFDLRKK